MKWIFHGPPPFLYQLGFLSRQKVYQFDLSPLQAGGKVQPLPGLGDTHIEEPPLFF